MDLANKLSLRGLALLGFFLSAFLSPALAQRQSEVKWEFKAENEELTLKATFGKGWHLYSQKDYGDEGPNPTSFTFTPSTNFELDGPAQEGKSLIKHMDKTWGFEIEFYELKAEFKQKIKSKVSIPYTIKGSLEYMICNDSMCLPPETVEFEIKVDPQKKNVVDAEISSCSPWRTFLDGFLFGFIALLTPCVYSMIPLTVSFFVKQSKDRKKGITNAIKYAFFIVFIYVVLGMLITIIFGPDALNTFASNVYVNIFFFLIFLVFAASFLGAFEITLPSTWINRADQASERGGTVGIFFMAFTLVLVSFSCTGPIIGNLLVQISKGGYLCPFMGMTGFSLCLALPFALFALFPAWLNSMPKSGGWLNSVKVALGFLEVALAIKFLSNADMVAGWHLISRELFIGIWIVTFGLMGIYLLGKIKFAHDSDVTHLSVTRTFFAMLTLTFTVYLIPGMWGAPLNVIAGFPPPSTPDWSENINHFKAKAGAGGSDTSVKGGHAETCPLDISCFHDYDEGLAFARKVGKPIMIDFTGWTCVNCRQMEQKVWPDPRVLNHLQNNYILISLFVDAREELPVEKQYTSTNTGKKIKTTGNRWHDLQISRYGATAQPLYVLLDLKEEMLLPQRAFNLNIDEYVKWLDAGLVEFKKRAPVKMAAPADSSAAKTGHPG